MWHCPFKLPVFFGILSKHIFGSYPTNFDCLRKWTNGALVRITFAQFSVNSRESSEYHRYFSSNRLQRNSLTSHLMHSYYSFMAPKAPLRIILSLKEVLHLRFFLPLSFHLCSFSFFPSFSGGFLVITCITYSSTHFLAEKRIWQINIWRNLVTLLRFSPW